MACAWIQAWMLSAYPASVQKTQSSTPVLEFQNWRNPRVAKSPTRSEVVSPTPRKQTQLREAIARRSWPWRDPCALWARRQMALGGRYSYIREAGAPAAILRCVTIGVSHSRSSTTRTMDVMPRKAKAVAPELARSASKPANAPEIEPTPP